MVEIHTSVSGDRERPLLFAKVSAGVVWALCWVVLTYCDLLSMGDARSAFIGTIVFSGIPVVFLAVRLVIFVNAQERQAPVAFWPGDRSSTLANWGLVLLMLYLACWSCLAVSELDQLFFNGQIMSSLDSVSS